MKTRERDAQICRRSDETRFLGVRSAFKAARKHLNKSKDSDCAFRILIRGAPGARSLCPRESYAPNSMQHRLLAPNSSKSSDGPEDLVRTGGGAEVKRDC